jgi:two-component system sensor kinase FixL
VAAALGGWAATPGRSGIHTRRIAVVNELAVAEAVAYNEPVFVGFVGDFSGRSWIESRVDQLSGHRLTAIGSMAGAMAHELDQPLAAMAVDLQTAWRMLLKTPGRRFAQGEDAIARTSKQVFRIGEIIGRLRDFVGDGEPDKTYQKLHARIEKAAAETASDGRAHGLAVAVDLSEPRDVVVMDQGAIGQVLSNLVRNARESVGDAREGGS